MDNDNEKQKLLRLSKLSKRRKENENKETNHRGLPGS
jgi:hypothetical protein